MVKIGGVRFLRVVEQRQCSRVFLVSTLQPCDQPRQDCGAMRVLRGTLPVLDASMQPARTRQPLEMAHSCASLTASSSSWLVAGLAAVDFTWAVIQVLSSE
jgi:hypothetical protein